MKSKILILLLVVLTACGGEKVGPEPVKPLPGPQLVLDQTFGLNGQVRTDLKQYNESYAAVLQPDGKIIAVGTTSGAGGNTFFGLVRYLPDGTLDTTFGDGGKVVTDLQPPGSSNRLAIPWAAALQSDGKIVVAGFRYVSDALASQQLLVIRYLSNGALDTSFGVGGFFSLETGRSAAYDVLVQSDGNIVVAGELGDDVLLLRLTPNGSLDRAFGTGGLASLPGSFSDVEASVALGKSGHYLVAAGRDLTRFSQDGTLDTSFENPQFERVYGPVSLALMADGHIVVGGTREVSYGARLTPQTSPALQTEIAIRRFNDDGGVDSSFGRDGIVVIGRGGPRALADLAVQPDGKIFLTGGPALVARLSADGVLEASSVGAFENAETVLVTQDDAAIIVGFTRSANGRDFALAKFLPQAAEVEQP